MHRGGVRAVVDRPPASRSAPPPRLEPVSEAHGATSLHPPASKGRLASAEHLQQEEEEEEQQQHKNIIMLCRQTPIVAMVMAACLVVTVLTPTAHGLTTAYLEVTTDSLPVATLGSHGSSETTDTGSTVTIATDSKTATTSATTSSVYVNVAVTTGTIPSIQTQLDTVMSTVKQSIGTNTLTTTATSVAELKVTDLQNSTSAAATEAEDLHSTTKTTPWEAQGASATQQTADLVSSVGNGTSGSTAKSQEAAVVTSMTAVADGSTNNIVPKASTQSIQPYTAPAIAHDSISTAWTLPTATLSTANATQSPLMESAAAPETASTTTSASSVALSGASATKQTTDNTLRVNYSITNYLPIDDDQFTAEMVPVTSTSSIRNSDVDITKPTEREVSIQPLVTSIIVDGSAASAVLTAALATVNTTESWVTELAAARESASTTSNLSPWATSENMMTAEALLVNMISSSGNASTGIAYEAADAAASNSSESNISTESTSSTKDAQPTPHYAIFTIIGGSVNTTSALLATSLAMADATQIPFTRSSGAQDIALTTNGMPLTTSSETSAITAAAAHSSPPHSQQSANISEDASLLADDTSTSATALISVKMAAPATSSTWFDKLLLSSTASLHDGVTTAYTSFDSCGATQTLTPPPTLFTDDGSNTTESSAWTPVPVPGYTAVALTVVIAAVVFAGAALIACTFIFIKCWAALRTCSARKRRGGSHKANASCGDGRSWPSNATSAAWRQARDVAAAGANATLGRSAAPTAAGSAAEDRLLSLWAGSDIVDEAVPRHAHSQAADNTERKRPVMLGDDRPDGQLNGIELSPFAASPLGARWPLTTFRGLSADYRAPMASHSPAYTALKIEVDDMSSTESGGTQRADANHYVVLPGDILAQTKL